MYWKVKNEVVKCSPWFQEGPGLPYSQQQLRGRKHQKSDWDSHHELSLDGAAACTERESLRAGVQGGKRETWGLQSRGGRDVSRDQSRARWGRETGHGPVH